MAFNYENFRSTKHLITFTGASGLGAIGVPFVWEDTPQAREGEFIYEVFYRVTTPLVSTTTASDYIEAGLEVDDVDCIFTSTTGIIDTINGNASGVKIDPAYTKAASIRNISFYANVSNITAGTLEIIITYAKIDGVNDFPEITS